MATRLNQPKDGLSHGLSFGPFHLLAGERLLTKAGVPIELGARALDILIVLTSTPNEVVSKKELIARVWPDVVVEEGSLRFHMINLRKALGDGVGGARYITTLPGRGYCFVAPVERTDDSRSDAPQAAAAFPHAILPHRHDRMVGRHDDILKLSEQVTASRLVSIVGSGGVGKTTVAIAVAHHVVRIFNGAVLFVDFGMLSDPNLVTPGVASMVGLAVGSDDVRPSLMAYLRDKRVLLILDTCEHLIDAVATLAAGIIEAAPQVHILATSREALRIDGERVYRLDALGCPPDDPDMKAEAVLSFPATQLFMERAAASGVHLDISDADARIVASICRKLDGVALAVELAARRMETYGLPQTAALLDQHLTLGWLGSRTAPPRQKTLQATLDWSFGLLTEPERVVLRRLAIFVGYFTLDAAIEVITSDLLNRSTVFGAMDSLVAKSLVATSPVGAMMRYRLLDTTRVYAHEIPTSEAERAALGVRHATYYQRWLEQIDTEWSMVSPGPDRVPYFVGLNNVRAALKWCFGENGDLGTGIRLAAAAMPIFQTMSLLSECHRWSERALAALPDSLRGSAEEMHLQAGLGNSSMYLHGERDAARAALGRGFEIAEARGNARDQLRLLGPLHMFHLRTGEFKTALHYARRCSVISATVEDPAPVALGHFILGNALHFSGDLRGARVELEAALKSAPRSRRSAASYHGFQGKELAGGILARNLWLQGHPAQAAARARQTIHESAEIDHSLTLCIALLGGIAISLWSGDLAGAEEQIERLISSAESRSLSPYVFVGQGFGGEVAIRRGHAKGGVDTLRGCLEKLHAATYEVFTTALEISLAQGLTALGQFDESITAIDKAIERVETNGDMCYMPELLRIRASLLLSMPHSRADEAENCFTQSLELSRHQGARAWELRSATDIAAYLASQGRSAEGQALLQPVFEQFTEGLDTADVKTAERLLAKLGK
jgi:predicted ATPase/DNA-binding winged helix-turn-helix (wHTH) protein